MANHESENERESKKDADSNTAASTASGSPEANPPTSQQCCTPPPNKKTKADTNSIVSVHGSEAAVSTTRSSSTGNHAKASAANTTNSSTQSFTRRLHNMLDAAEEEGFAEIVSWQPHGRCFVVHQREEFIEKVLPIYFVSPKFTSFQRQLNIYGFSRITQGRDKNGYHHDKFLRGRHELSDGLRRRFKGTGPRKPDMPEIEPDFYSYPSLSGAGATVGAEGEGEQDEQAVGQQGRRPPTNNLSAESFVGFW